MTQAGVSGEDGQAWRGDDLKPTWNLYRRMAESMLNSARRQVVLWALDQLEGLMGAGWLGRYFEKAGHVPEDVNLGAGHVAATRHLLDMALRCHADADSPSGCRSDPGLPHIYADRRVPGTRAHAAEHALISRGAARRWRRGRGR